jgi:L-alanine-DL-glutamate epimerase-like enolase superfamily enzyme
VANQIYPADVLGPTFVEDILAVPLKISGGYGTPPDGPGLGIELDKAVMEKYTVSV